MSVAGFDAGLALRILAKLHGQMERLAFRAIEVQVEGFSIAAKIGAQLIAAQAAMRGDYEDWIESHYRRLRFGIRQARRYKQVARIVAEAGGLEAAIADLHALRAMQSALNFKLAELPDQPGTAEAEPRFEQFRIPVDPAAVPDDQAPMVLERIEETITRLQRFCRQLAERVAAAESAIEA